MLTGVNVLVVEDELEIAESLCRGLNEAGIRADYAITAADAMAAFERQAPYDVAILDVGLGGIGDGYDLCRRLRGRGATTAILMLTARTDVSDRLKGFDVGADDYLAKPFAFDEVLARVRALSRRRIALPLDDHLEFDDLRMDIRTRIVTAGSSQLSLTLREYDVLELFLRHPGQLLSKQQIRDAIWSHDVDPASGLVEVYIGRIRARLRAASSRTTIENARAQGYRLVADHDR